MADGAGTCSLPALLHGRLLTSSPTSQADQGYGPEQGDGQDQGYKQAPNTRYGGGGQGFGGGKGMC
jgi:hypothetical protein